MIPRARGNPVYYSTDREECDRTPDTTANYYYHMMSHLGVILGHILKLMNQK